MSKSKELLNKALKDIELYTTVIGSDTTQAHWIWNELLESRTELLNEVRGIFEKIIDGTRFPDKDVAPHLKSIVKSKLKALEGE